MRQRRAQIAARHRFFLGCEGESEQSYGRLLQQIADEEIPHLHIHLDIQVFQGGDPLAIVTAAYRTAHQLAKNHGRFRARAVLLDTDRRGQNPERDREMERLVQREALVLVWQDPCHEALLLRHLESCQSLRPANSAAARIALSRQWPEYRKATAARQLALRIGLPQIQAAAGVELDLRAFLSLLGFPLL
jgi:hypothetical protein